MWLCTHVVSCHLHKMNTGLVLSPLPMRLPPPSSNNSYANTLTSINNSAIFEYSQNHPGEEIKMVYDNTLSDRLLHCVAIFWESDVKARELFESGRLDFGTKLRDLHDMQQDVPRAHNKRWVREHILTPLMNTLRHTLKGICPECRSTPSDPMREKIVMPDYIYSGMIGEWMSPYKLPAAAIDLENRIDELGALLLRPGRAQSDNWVRLANKVS